jgi:proteasome activator subunit 4
MSSIKIGDLTQTVPLDLGSDAPGEDIMADKDPASYSGTPLNDAAEPLGQRLSLREERTLVRESTASFPGAHFRDVGSTLNFRLICSLDIQDWVTSFFRRVFALFENLPEEGGKSNRTGGKSEGTSWLWRRVCSRCANIIIQKLF